MKKKLLLVPVAIALVATFLITGCAKKNSSSATTEQKTESTVTPEITWATYDSDADRSSFAMDDDTMKAIVDAVNGKEFEANSTYEFTGITFKDSELEGVKLFVEFIYEDATFDTATRTISFAKYSVANITVDYNEGGEVTVSGKSGKAL